jgi:hypothetical protein
MSEQPFDLRTDSIFEVFPKWQGLAIVFLAAPLLIIFDGLGSSGAGGIAWVSVVSMGFAGRTFWPLRRELWFWVTMTCTGAAHVAAVAFYPWPDESHPGWVLALAMLADIALVLGVIALVATSIRRASKVST